MARNTRQVPISSKNTRSARAAHARATREFRTYDTSAIRPKRSNAPMVIAIIVIAIGVATALGALFYFFVYEEETIPVGEQAVIVVSDGESASDVASSLFQERLIGNENKFMDRVDAMGAGASILPGTYQFTGGMTMDEIIECLMAGPASTSDMVTIPEGATRQNVAEAVQVATSGRITAEQFLEASDDASVYAGTYDFLKSAGDNPLEGFLFPKTYAVTVNDDAGAIVEMMLSQFALETEGLDLSYPESQGLDIYGVVKLASILQKEGVVENYGKVASVFYNRISIGMALQSDATTAYEVGHEPTGEEVHADTPYSTYAHEGLPPTPICNPSLEALQAVCSPENTDYMYFYSYDDGTYAFSETYEEHQDAIPE